MIPAIVTDSSACLPPSLLSRHGIRTVPLSLRIGDQVYADGSLSPAELFRLAEGSQRPAQTASPSPAQFVEAFREAAERGADSVLCLTLAAAFSGTHDSAIAARELAAADLPRLNVQVVDTGGLAMTHGFAVLAAARVLESGATVEEAAAAGVRCGGSARLAGMLGTMRYLARGGRVPWIVHWAAQVLHIRPLLAYEAGRARSIGRVRTEAKGLERLIEYARKQEGPLRIAVMHTEADEAAARLAEMACRELAPVELLNTDFTSVMAVHTGPGFVGLAVCADD